jgi:acyl carrier protein
MTKDDITLLCLEYCCIHFGISEEECADTVCFDDFAVDDLDRVEMAIFVENNFDIYFTDDIDYRTITFGNLVNMIEKKLEEKNETESAVQGDQNV